MDLKARIHRIHTAPSENRVAETAPTPVPQDESPQTEWSDDELRWKDALYKKLLKVMDLAMLASVEEGEARQQIREILQRLMLEESVPLNSVSRQRLVKGIEDEILGLGPLEPLLADPTISDILVNGHASVYVERAGRLTKTKVRFDNDSHLMNIIDRIVSNVGRRIDESFPMVDARLKDGSRVNVIIPPLAVDGPLLSIRRFGVDMLGMPDLIRTGSIAPFMADVLQRVVAGRLNIVVSGGTGSGKTTLLNILSGFTPEYERIVTIEDSAELQLRQPHVARLETRPPNIEGKGEVLQRELVRNSLRMRPDRIVLGEIRGAEALDMLQAMNTGHDGSLTTIHANTPRDALGRIENMVAMTGLNLPISAVRSQMASAIDLVVQIERFEDGRRCLVSIQEVNGMEGEIITMSEIFRFDRHGIDEDGKVLGEFRATGILPKFADQLAQKGLSLDADAFNPNHRHTMEQDHG
jgi:pilus assembly protein CpaF